MKALSEVVVVSSGRVAVNDLAMASTLAAEVSMVEESFFIFSVIPSVSVHPGNWGFLPPQQGSCAFPDCQGLLLLYDFDSPPTFSRLPCVIKKSFQCDVTS